MIHIHIPYKSFIFAKTEQIIEFINIPDFLGGKKVEHCLNEFIVSQGFKAERLTYNFVTKLQLHEMNIKYLSHTSHTDIISFDYSRNKQIKAEFFISMWAVNKSAEEEEQTIENETLRVISHGVLHCMGYTDKIVSQKAKMRKKEDEFISLFHVKHKTNV